MKKLFFGLMAVMALFTMDAGAQVKKPLAKKKTTVSSKTKPVAKKPIKKLAVPSLSVANATRIKIWTDSGTIIVKLYDSTPLHKENFMKLVKMGFYDSLLFHRVIPGFMIQGGDPLSKDASPGVMLGGGGGDMERIPAEIRREFIHKKGALAAARDGNPAKASSACQFYLVEGKILSDGELDMMEQRLGFKYSAEQRKIYKTIGGTPFLDQNYTVFGEVEQGLEVISKIVNVSRDARDRPIGDVRMKMELMVAEK
ncbi:MAG: peptidylprolyl isomerase [Ferruginibacter sp.]